MKFGALRAGTVSHNILRTIDQAGMCEGDAIADLQGCTRSRVHELKQMGMVRKVFVLTDAGKRHLAKLDQIEAGAQK
jgi:hypothetical protein